MTDKLRENKGKYYDFLGVNKIGQAHLIISTTDLTKLPTDLTAYSTAFYVSQSGEQKDYILVAKSEEPTNLTWVLKPKQENGGGTGSADTIVKASQEEIDAIVDGIIANY